MASASMRSTSRLAVAVLLAVATTTSAQGSGSFDVTNVLCLEAFACSADASLPRESVELLVGAELTRRAFTNACNIMQRHGFAKAWARWRQ